MNTYIELKTWLADTERNQYIFINGAPTISSYRNEWTLAQRALTTILNDIDLRGKMSKEEYVEWRQMWKWTYAKLTSESRWAKMNRKGGSDNAIRNIENVEMLRYRANDLLEMRKRSKEMCTRYYEKVDNEAVAA